MAETPDTSAQPNVPLSERVAEVIDQIIRPGIQSDGGDLELVGVDQQGVVTVRFHGACVGCPAASMTLTMGVERLLKEKIPQVSKVVLA